MTDQSSDTIMSGYIFKSYAHRADAEYTPSLIGRPVNGSSAQAAYYERVDLPSRHVTALAVTQYVVEGSDPLDPILQARHPKGFIYYIPKSELAEAAAENQDDDTWEMLNRLFKGRVF